MPFKIKVGIIDYGVGNLGSVARALEELRTSPVLVDRAVDLHTNDCLVLPGVGNFTSCMLILEREGWASAIKDEVKVYHRPLLGICLGMQLLADFGSEGATDVNIATAGLGLIPGRVESFVSQGCSLRVPHVGWNSIAHSESGATLFNGIPDGTDFYFVHSYIFAPNERNSVLAECEYGIPFTAAVGIEHVFGVQFHPEKSSKAGFRIFHNFIEYSKC